MADITSWSKLKEALVKGRTEALRESAKESVDYIKDRVIDQEVYGRGSPEFYERTYQLKDSLRANPAEGVRNYSASIVIDHDTSKIKVNLPMYQHGSPMSGGIADAIPLIVHDGLSGSMFGDGFWMEPRPYMGTARNDLQAGKLRRMMVKELRDYGFDAS